jgi:sec-independent protein translocase protein TatC
MPESLPRETIRKHLRELAYRIKWAFVWFLIGFAIAYFFKEEILEWLVAPLAPAMKGHPQLHFTSPVEPFFTFIKLALKAGIVIAIPGILYNIWSFIAPGLHKTEKRFTIFVTLFGALFFAMGVLFAYFFVFPYGFQFLISFAQDSPGNFKLLPVLGEVLKETYGVIPSIDMGTVRVSLEPTIMMGDYLKLIISLLLAFGIVFELPLLVYFLITTGITSPRGLIAFFRYFVVIAFVLSAILTPPDIVTQILMALPLITMYLLSTLVAWIVIVRREKNQSK